MTPPDPCGALAGAYVVGALDAAQRQAFEEHLRACGACRAEVARLAPLPPLLRRLPPPPPAGLQGGTKSPTLAALAGRLARRRRRTRQVVLGALVAAAALAGVLAVPALQESSVSRGRMVSLSGTQAAGTAQLDARAWGTQVILTLSGLPAGDPATAAVTGPSGAAERAGSWISPSDGRAVLEVATKLEPAAITSVTVIDTRTGRTIMRS